MSNFNDFVHLHVHSEYSLLDGYSSIDKYIEALKNLGQSAMGLTDHGNMYGAIEFYRKMRAAELQPILGEEFYIASWGSTIDNKVRKFDHMLLLAQTQQGYQHMLKLSSIANTRGFYYKGRIDFNLLGEYNEGIVATSGCAAAPIFSSIIEGKHELANKITAWMKEVFGNRFYIELQWHPGLPEHNNNIRHLLALAHEYDVKCILTNDAHYAFEADAPMQDLLLCLQTNKRIDDVSRMKFSDGEYYAKSAKELRQNLQGYLDNSEIDAIFKTTCEIAESCSEVNPEGDKKPKIPVIEVIAPHKSVDEYLKSLSFDGLVALGKDKEPSYIQRLGEELSVIKKTKFAEYFIIINDICKWASQKKISWNTRGSAAGSLVFYALGVSFVDPIKHNLMFSRFLNEYRISIPDCDLDFPDSRRHEIIKYIVDKYGEENTAQIVTFGRMKARMAIRDVGRAMGLWRDDVDLVAKSIKNTPGKPINLHNSLDEESEYYSADFHKHYKNSKFTKLVDNAMQLEQTTRHTGVHAAAVLISDKPLVNYVPLQRGGKTAITWHIAAMDYPTCESIGLLKVDCLGLSTLTIIDSACELINKRHNTTLTYWNIPYEESSGFDLLCAANCIGVFQVENQGLRRALAQLQPRNFTQVADIISLYRPGPIQYIPEYIQQAHHPIIINYKHPLLEQITSTTAGVCIYQEQVIRILVLLAGYTEVEADGIRKAISKKDVKKIADGREKFIKGCTKHNKIDKETSANIYDDLEKFALYSFNLAHAASYARITLITAWLKANYCIEYLTACLDVEGTDETKRAKYVNDAKKNGIEVLPPKLGDSSLSFYIDDQSIRFGYSNIKDVGDKAAAKLADVKTLSDIAKLKLNRSVIEALTAAGVFDSLGLRKLLLSNVDSLMKYIGIYNKTQNTGQRAFTYADMEYQSLIPSNVAQFEKLHLGVWLTHHPLDKKRIQYDKMNLDTSIDISSYEDGDNVYMMGAIQEIKEVVTKRGDKMAFVTLSDYTGFTSIIIFPKVYGLLAEPLESGQVLHVQGKIQHGDEETSVLAQNITIMKDWV